MANEQITGPPRFTSEKEEAEWWDSHPDFILQEFERAEAEGRLGQGIVKRRMQEMDAAKGTTLRLDAADFEIATKLAERKGVEREAYLKELVHAALLKEAEVLGESSAA